MKKLVCLSLAVALGIICYETEAMGSLRKTLAKSVAARAAAGQDVSAADVEGLVNDPAIMSKLSIEEQINNYIAAGNQVCFTGNWNEVLRTPGVTVPIARLMSRVKIVDRTKLSPLLNDNFAERPPRMVSGGSDGAISSVFTKMVIDRLGYADLNAALDEIDRLDLTAYYNWSNLQIMGVLYAVSKGFGVPDTQINAQEATSDGMLIGPIGGDLVAPWTNPDGSGPTDAQKLRAAKLYYKIAKTETASIPQQQESRLLPEITQGKNEIAELKAENETLRTEIAELERQLEEKRNTNVPIWSNSNTPEE